jgi:hypothetical protein
LFCAWRRLLWYGGPEFGDHCRLVAPVLPGNAPGQRGKQKQVRQYGKRHRARPAWGLGGRKLIAVVVGVHAVV